MVYETKGKNDGLEDWSIYIRDEDAIHTSNFSVSILLEAINFIISLLRISFIKKKKRPACVFLGYTMLKKIVDYVSF